ncbi:MAG: hypothetical protein PV340_01040 [Wolbachia sp.]|nr:hypothetical protein [Wolbachia sp.]MDD9336445.1 hypothetical protein [Wolbachia sp.]
MSKISNTEKPKELKNNEVTETLGNNNQKQQTEKSPDQGRGLDNQK